VGMAMIVRVPVIMGMTMVVRVAVIMGMTVIMGMAMIVRMIVVVRFVVAVVAVVGVGLVGCGRRSERRGRFGRAGDGAERNSLFAGDPGAVVELGREDRLLAAAPAELAADRAEGRLHRLFAPAAFRTLERAATDAERSGFCKQDRLDRGGVGRTAQDAQ